MIGRKVVVLLAAQIASESGGAGDDDSGNYGIRVALGIGFCLVLIFLA